MQHTCESGQGPRVARGQFTRGAGIAAFYAWQRGEPTPGELVGHPSDTSRSVHL